ncbi:hypothetical protein HMPREF1548_04810 [Clostridium sp. KLE 1755]|nr:hypothetical protein HMPREF1548_04810 [Clostridium sp. KLE 1755]
MLTKQLKDGYRRAVFNAKNLPIFFRTYQKIPAPPKIYLPHSPPHAPDKIPNQPTTFNTFRS